jgi:hypothetical protein
MHSSFSNGNPTKNGKGTLFYVLGEATPADKCCNLGVMTSMDVMSSRAMIMVMLMMISLSMMVMLMSVSVMVIVSRRSLVTVMAAYQKAPTCDPISLAALEAAGRQIDWQCLQCLLKNFLGNSEIPECRNGHVAADSGKCIDMKEFHDGEILAVEGILRVTHSHLLSWETAMQKN